MCVCVYLRVCVYVCVFVCMCGVPACVCMCVHVQMCMHSICMHVSVCMVCVRCVRQCKCHYEQTHMGVSTYHAESSGENEVSISKPLYTSVFHILMACDLLVKTEPTS